MKEKLSQHHKNFQSREKILTVKEYSHNTIKILRAKSKRKFSEQKQILTVKEIFLQHHENSRSIRKTLTAKDKFSQHHKSSPSKIKVLIAKEKIS